MPVSSTERIKRTESCPDRTMTKFTIPDGGKEANPASHEVLVDNEMMPEAIIGNTTKPVVSQYLR